MSLGKAAAFGALLLALAPALEADPPDGVDLRVNRGPGAGEVTLTWTGGLAPYDVFRSNQRAGVTDPPNLIASTNQQTLADLPPAGQIFYYAVTPSACASNEECPTGFCVDTVCCDTACAGTCETCNLGGAEGTCTPFPPGQDPEAECASGAACDGAGSCKLLTGEACATGGDCLSGFCADGVCCDTACDGVCELCDSPGSLGSCVPVPAGVDPDNECTADPPSSCDQAGACSGTRSCALYMAGTICAAPTCASASSANLPDTCDGTGSCVDGGVQTCSPYACGGSGVCGTSCAANLDCASGFFCALPSGECQACTMVDPPELTFSDSNCDGIDGDIAGAIFVNDLAGNDANPGTMASPKLTIASAIAAAASSSKDVYVSKSTYDEAIVLSNGVSLFGGYDAASGWSRAPSNTTAITAGSSATAISGTNISLSTELQLLDIYSNDALATGASSYGLRLIDSTGVTVTACLVDAGNGAPGMQAASGTAGLPGFSGGPGSPGCEDSSGFCSTCPTPPVGSPGASSCGRSGGFGGAPGRAMAPGMSGGGGVGGTAGGAGGAGGGGPQGCGNPVFNGQQGGTGQAGAQGPNGSPGASFGVASSGGYTVASGGDGSAGSHGNGGGGGGGGGGGDDNCDSYGSSGGGGGGGGCTGTVGAGGQGGGGSFAVYLGNSSIVITQSQLFTGQGGAGGAGGIGGTGGVGGGPGPGGPYGGAGEQDDAGCGGSGGAGGSGGQGGHGGGGGGGPSVGIVCGAGSSLTSSGNTISPGSGGVGGSSSGSSGANGISSSAQGC